MARLTLDGLKKQFDVCDSEEYIRVTNDIKKYARTQNSLVFDANEVPLFVRKELESDGFKVVVNQGDGRYYQDKVTISGW